MIRRGKETNIPVFDYLPGIFRCDKAKIMEYMDIQSHESVLKGAEDMSGLGQPIMLEGMQLSLFFCLELTIQ